MKTEVEFLGAYDTVTGSKTVLTRGSKHYLIDCGLFQGEPELRQRNRERLAIEASRIEAVFLTHAHLDHSGYLPCLYKHGFRGKVYCAGGTKQLADIILRDSARLEEELADYAKQTGYSRHEKPVPLFTLEDAEAILQRFEVLPRNQWIDIDPDMSVQLVRSGHLIGSSFIQFRFDAAHAPKTMTFSGDLGNHRSHTLKGPEGINETGTLVLESTYGNRLHSPESSLVQLGRCLKKVLSRSGVAIIPAFAVGRSQEIIYMISELERLGVIPSVPVILDSPMSRRALDVFMTHHEDQVFDKGFGPNQEQFFPKLFEAIETPDQSMLACQMDGPAIIISASGMLSGGRVLHHLKKRLPGERNMVIFAGYQAPGTKGAYLQSQGKIEGKIRLHHHEIEVLAEIETIDSLSSHADYSEIITWLKGNRSLPKRIILNHGTIEAQDHLASQLSELGCEIICSHRIQKVDINNDTI